MFDNIYIFNKKGKSTEFHDFHTLENTYQIIESGTNTYHFSLHAIITIVIYFQCDKQKDVIWKGYIIIFCQHKLNNNIEY